MVSDPGGPHSARPSALDDMVFDYLNSLDFHNYHPFGAQYTPCPLAVYASHWPLPEQHARLATERLAKTYSDGTLTREIPPALPGALKFGV